MRDTHLEGGPQLPVVARVPARVPTPAFPPRAVPGDAPPTGVRTDAEGNEVAEVGGRWHLAETATPRLAFPIKSGYKVQLLPPNPNAAYARLHANVEAIRDAQLETAKTLKGDPKYWFAKVYHFVTKFELESIDHGTYLYPHMKLQEVELFHATYAANLAAWQAGDLAKVEGNWKAAFAAAEGSQSGVQQFLSESMAIKNALLPSMEAHIRFDLPRALAAAYNNHYSGIPHSSLDDFRPDFFAMGPVFDQANDALAPEIDEEGTDFNPTNWGWVGDLGFPFLFAVGLEREHAWEKAEMISKGTGMPLPALESRMRSYLGTAHPNADPFEVDDTNVADYDWQTQPGVGTDTQPPPDHAPATPPPVEFPMRLFFRLDKPDGPTELADAVRRDQDLAPLLRLAEWTRSVRNAVIRLEGHASTEGPEYHNDNLAVARGDLVEFFLFRASADVDNNTMLQTPSGEIGSSATKEFRYVDIAVTSPGVSKQQVWSPASNLPSSPPAP